MEALYNGEMQLAGWSDSHTGGAKVTFWLPDASDLEVFRALTTRKGNTAGHRFAVALVEIGDDEKPVPPLAEKPKGGEIAKWLGIRCADPEFQEFIAHRAFETQIGVQDIDGADACAEAVRQICEVGSRAEFDNDATAADRFHDRIRLSWIEWQAGREA